ncbi:putative DNA helicase ino80 [Coemansia biformis]|uniref:Chromatin-remodeling ATPase INO80 n=1 Tax=Coemansia biformis TaxID=1286918 RepID=A0A9W7YFR5_9FUNG|nr:putative DNA helicase ino80 [Coemansia biformis]
MSYERSPANPHNLSSLLAPRDGGAAPEPDLTRPRASSYAPVDPDYQRGAGFDGPPPPQQSSRRSDYPQYNGGYDYAQRDARGREYAPQQYEYSESGAAQYSRTPDQRQYAGYRDGYDRRDYDYGDPAHRHHQPDYGYGYEYDHPHHRSHDPRDPYDHAAYSDDRQRYAYPTHPAGGGAADEYYYSRQQEQPQHAYGAPAREYYDDRSRYDYQQDGGVPPMQQTHPEDPRSPGQAQQKYSSRQPGPYAYDAPAPASDPRDADPKLADVDAPYQPPQASAAYGDRGADARPYGYNPADDMAGSRYRRSPAHQPYPAGADYRSPAPGAHTQVFQRDRAYEPGSEYPVDGDPYARDAAAYADSHLAPGRPAGMGITSLLADTPTARRPLGNDPYAYSQYGEYPRPSHRDYAAAPEGYHGYDTGGYIEHPHTHGADPHGVMSISQLVGSGGGSEAHRPAVQVEGEYGYARRAPDDAAVAAPYGMRTPPGHIAAQGAGHSPDLSPDVPLAHHHRHHYHHHHHHHRDQWAEPPAAGAMEPIVVTDDDSAAVQARNGSRSRHAAARARLDSDDENQPLAIQTGLGEAVTSEQGRTPGKRRQQAQKGGRRRNGSTAKGASKDTVGGRQNGAVATRSSTRRQPRKTRNSMKVELSREYVYDDDEEANDEDEDDDDDIPLEQSTAVLRYLRDTSGDQEVAASGPGAPGGSGAHALPAGDYSVDESVQAYIHHVKKRTDRALAKDEERARRKDERIHEHVVQRYGPYLKGYFESTGERLDYGDGEGDEYLADGPPRETEYDAMTDSGEAAHAGRRAAHHRSRGGHANGYVDYPDDSPASLAYGRMQPPPMGYFTPSKPVSPGGYGLGYERGGSPASAESEPLALLAEEEAAGALRGRAAYGEHGSHGSVWTRLSVEHIPRAFRHMQGSIQVRNANMRKVVQLCQREVRRMYGPAPTRTNQLNPHQSIIVQRPPKELLNRARRSMREMLMFWKRYEKEEREMRKRAEREAAERQKQEEEARETRRQARKLNFLITQTELYSHFIGNKIDQDAPPAGEPKDAGDAAQFQAIDFDDADDAALTERARQSAQNALAQQQAQTREFDEARRKQHGSTAGVPSTAPDASVADALDTMDFQQPETLGGPEIAQPRMLMCQLKEYQLKGLSWLANLYEQGINGILADEMGLGKTVQSISLLAYLAETHNIWGPFMVVAPASTLHNWQQELTRFVPEFKVLPYWGAPKDRKVLRKSLWNPKSLSRRDSAFHVMITSYQMVTKDESYLNRVKWQYMVLDEAQAIKSSESTRWKTLLGFHCRNRLLLTGTPIQNSMQELWALLHFIMPTLFDSHEEFSEWFSRDIEAHAENRSMLNKHQLYRLHMILKPFMLRRIKSHVQHELGKKIEKLVECDLTKRQKDMYRGLMSKLSLTELLQSLQSSSTQGGKDDANENLMNLVMQFRKVCSHPELFERAEVESPYLSGVFPATGSLAREGDRVSCSYATQSIVSFMLPKLVYRESLETPRVVTARQGVLNRLTLWSPARISEARAAGSTLALLRLCAPSVGQATRAFCGSLVERLGDVGEYDAKHSALGQHLLEARDDGELAASPALRALQPGSVLHALTNVFSPQNLSVSPALAGLARITQRRFAHSYMRMVSPAYKPQAVAPPVNLIVSDRSATWEHDDTLLRHPLAGRVRGGPDAASEAVDWSQPFRQQGGTDIWLPSKDKLIRYSGKMAMLDRLLMRLKQNGHRVLLYFQMTKMIDLFEEYLAYRKYSYLRLDGSSKIADRRDMVMDWQTRDDIFIFLLTTRAGGLGINLTAADTVIFYESDWNPTVDSQAMDRAHRLGQTKQVVVYRLISRGTVEERILQRARQKDEIHRIVIAGGDVKTATDEAGGDAGGSGEPAEDLSTDAQPSSKEIMSWLLGEAADDGSAAHSKRLAQARLAQDTSNRIYGGGGYPGRLDLHSLGRSDDDVWSQVVPLPPPNVGAMAATTAGGVAGGAGAALDAVLEAALWEQQRGLEQARREMQRQRGRGRGRGGRGGTGAAAGVAREKRRARGSAGGVAGSRTDTPEPTSKRLRANNGSGVSSGAPTPSEGEAADATVAGAAITG